VKKRIQQELARQFCDNRDRHFASYPPSFEMHGDAEQHCLLDRAEESNMPSMQRRHLSAKLFVTTA
jgi:hypothetical protein